MKVRNLTIAVALGLVTAAFAASPGSATRPDDRANRLGALATAQSTRPDDRAVRVSTSADSESVVRPDDRSARPSTPGAIPVERVASDTFSWTDVAAGAGVFAILALFGAGLIWNLRYERRAA